MKDRCSDALPRIHGAADVRLFHVLPDFTPYTALPNNINLVNGGMAARSSKARYYANKVQKLDLSAPDRINEDTFNRYIWHTIKGNTRYPARFAGAHGKGLKKLNLMLTGEKDDD